MSALDVHLHGQLVGSLVAGDQPGEYSFRYDGDLAAGRPGEPLLSVSLPCRAEPYGPTEARPFFDGLLPEGAVREQLGRDLKLSPDNSFGFLRELGRDCAGAVVLMPSGEPLPRDSSVEWLSDAGLAELVRRLPTNPLGVSGRGKGRLSLAGMQRKAVLARGPDGDYGLPGPDIPSTHILKPQFADVDYDDLAVNEHFCMRSAAAAGLEVATTELATIAERACLVVERFDRAVEGGSLVRLHQEDLCQALGVPPGRKYQAEGGPGLRDVAELLRDVSPRGGADVLALVRATVANFVLGNGDAHAKNLALLYGDGGPRLAPLYDVVCTGAYAELDRSLAMSIGENPDPDELDGGDLFDLAEDCGLSPRELAREWRRTAAVVARAAETVDRRARADGWHRPVLDRAMDVVRRRSTQLG